MTSTKEPIFAVCHVVSSARIDMAWNSKGTCLEGDVIISQPNFELLPSILVLRRPLRVVFSHDFTVLDDLLDLGD